MSSSEAGTHSRVLDPNKISQLSNKAKNQERSVHLKWPTIDDCVRMVNYIKKDCSGILYLKTSRGEQLFNVTHDTNNAEKIFIRPADHTLAPCGWFELHALEKTLAADAVVVGDS